MEDNASKRSHSNLVNDNVNGGNDDYDQYQRDEEMPLEGNNGAMIETDNDVDTGVNTAALQVNTKMNDKNIDVTETTDSLAQADTVVRDNNNQPYRSTMEDIQNINKMTVKELREELGKRGLLKKGNKLEARS